MQKIRKEHGTTLLVLVITIIILLILAGITISAITGDNGIIGNAGQAKEETEIANEKEIVEKATVQAMGNNKYGNIEESELQKQLNKETKEGKTEVSDVRDEFEVVFNESKRYYLVDKDGNVEGVYEIIEDKHPGDITVGKDGETLDGNTEETAYQIWCIEDLVEWSQNYRNYQNSHIELKRTLNFESRLSYVNGKMLNCNSIEELRELLTNTSGSGFTPINNFSGIFDGKNFEIQNIYENVSENAGLFEKASGIIKNLKISGNIISNSRYAGGFAGTNMDGFYISNCMNYCNIINHSELDNSNGNISGCAGGIIGRSVSNTIFDNCANMGNINANTGGGIIGYEYAGNNIEILNCVNKGEIYATNAGGIVGSTTAGAIQIYNSYNIGNVLGSSYAGGIMGYKYHNTVTEIKNVYNCSKVEGNYQGEIIGFNWAYDTTSSPMIENVFYTNQTIGPFGQSASAIGIPVYCEDISDNKIVSQLNDYVSSITEQDTLWNKWKICEGGYPVFQ